MSTWYQVDTIEKESGKLRREFYDGEAEAMVAGEVRRNSGDFSSVRVERWIGESGEREFDLLLFEYREREEAIDPPCPTCGMVDRVGDCCREDSELPPPPPPSRVTRPAWPRIPDHGDAERSLAELAVALTRGMDQAGTMAPIKDALGISRNEIEAIFFFGLSSIKLGLEDMIDEASSRGAEAIQAIGEIEAAMSDDDPPRPIHKMEDDRNAQYREKGAAERAVRRLLDFIERGIWPRTFHLVGKPVCPICGERNVGALEDHLEASHGKEG